MSESASRWSMVRIVVALVLLAISPFLPTPVRALVVLPIALVLPGYILLAGLRARRVGDDTLATIATSSIISLALLTLLGLSMYALNVRVTGANVAHIIIAFVILVVLAVPSLRAAPATTRGELALQSVGAFRSLLVPVVTVSLAIAAVAMFVAFVPGHKTASFTATAFAGTLAKGGDATLVAADQSQQVHVVIRNLTGRRQVYHVRPSMRGASWFGTTIRLHSGETWRGSVVGSVPAGGCLRRLIVRVVPVDSPVRINGLTAWFRTRELPQGCTVITA